MALRVKFVLPLLFVIMAVSAKEASPDPEADTIIQQADEKVSKIKETGECRLTSYDIL